MAEYAVETFSLTKVFSDWWGRSRLCAVDNLDLQVRHNEVFGLLGPNGSGKTTTLKLLLGLLYPTKGKALVLGGDATNPKISARIGFMPEESYLYKYLTARETLNFYGRLFDLGREVRRSRIEALLDMVGLKAVANRPVGTFSKGMARRIGLAQALINDPDLLILDEPTTGLDPMGTRQIKDLILELAKRGKTVLLCSHLLADVEDICDRIAILYGGKIQSEGAVKDLLAQTDRRQITTGNISAGAVERIREIVEAENSDFELTSPVEKLESFFIRTITAARRKGPAASGVVSDGTAISDFLSAGRQDKSSEAILEKLVQAEPRQEAVERMPVGQQSLPKETTAKPDEQLLGRLTRESSEAGTTPVVQQPDKPGEPDGPVQRQSEQNGENILRRLTDSGQENLKDDKKPEGGEEGGGDA